MRAYYLINIVSFRLFLTLLPGAAITAAPPYGYVANEMGNTVSVVNLATNKPVLDAQESTTKLSPNAEQLTLEKSLPLASLQPGQYQLNIKVNDLAGKQHTEESAKFSVD